MDILSKTDDEVYEIAKPIWDNLVKSSNMKDYGGFTRDFSTQMLFGANEVELGKQWANNKIITNLVIIFHHLYILFVFFVCILICSEIFCDNQVFSYVDLLEQSEQTFV